MKKPLLLSLAILALYLPASAQFSFGIKGSVTQAWHSKNPSDAAKMQGLSTTLLMYKRVGKFLEIGMEPGIVQRGTTQSFNQDLYYGCYICCFGDCEFPYNDFYGNKSGLKASYIQAPLAVRANLPLAKGKVSLSGKMGGGPSWLASGYYDTEVYDDRTFQNIPENKALDFSEDKGIRRWDFGLYSGAGIGTKLGCGMLAFEAEYYHGLRDVADYADFRNRGISYSLGYIIHL